MSASKLVYMCPICRNRVEYNIGSVTMYTHENKLIDGALEEIEIEQPINTAAIVTTINPLKCAHLKNTDKCHLPYKMIAVPEWTPTLVDKIVKIFPDIYNIQVLFQPFACHSYVSNSRMLFGLFSIFDDSNIADILGK